MSLLKNLSIDTSIEEDKDVLGGSKFQAWESGVYNTVIELAYLDEAKSGALSVNFIFKTSDGKELRQNIYVTSGKEKGQLNYYTNAEGTKKYLPGFVIVNDICTLATTNALSDIETETKVLSLYSYEQKKEVPTKKEVLVDLLGKEVTLGIVKIIQDKYKKPGETQTINDISKVFRAEDHFTVNELKASETEATFYTAWKEKNEGKTINKVSKEGAKPTEKTDTAPKSSLFSKK